MPPPALLTARGGMRGPLPWTTGITAIYAAKGVIFTRRSGGQYSTPIDKFGFVEAYRAKKDLMASWLDDDRPEVRRYAEAHIRKLDRMIASEQRSAEQRQELRKREFGEEDDARPA